MFRRTKLPKIDKSSADPEILKDYQELRNERRSSKMPLFLELFRGIYLAFIMAWILLVYPRFGGLTTLLVLMVVGILIVLSSLGAMVVWAPRDNRLMMAGLFVGFIVMIIAAAAIVTFGPLLFF